MHRSQTASALNSWLSPLTEANVILLHLVGRQAGLGFQCVGSVRTGGAGAGWRCGRWPSSSGCRSAMSMSLMVARRRAPDHHGRRRQRFEHTATPRCRLLRDLRDPCAADRRADGKRPGFHSAAGAGYRRNHCRSPKRLVSAFAAPPSNPAHLRCPERCTRLAHRPASARAMPLRICKFRNRHDRSSIASLPSRVVACSFRVVAAMRPRGNGPGNSDPAANQRHRAEPDRPAQAASSTVHNRCSGTQRPPRQRKSRCRAHCRSSPTSSQP